MITRRYGFSRYETHYAAGLPPPLCFTVPDRSVNHQGAPAGALQAGGAQMLGMSRPGMMMDPSDPSTWQRPYRFTR